MGINKELWSTLAEVELFEKTPLVTVANRKFEGELQKGKTVNVYTYSIDEEIDSTYDGDTAVDFKRLKPATKSLSVDQIRSFGFRVENMDLIQNSPDSVGMFLESAIYLSSS